MVVVYPSTPGISCPLGWQPYGEFCYFINDEASFTYEQARQECVAKDAALASVLDQDEQDFLDGK